jgi:CHASE2 domain-containing sensor protein
MRNADRLLPAAWLIVIGVVGQTLTFQWDHPLTFLAFLFVASPLVVAGVLMFLWSLARN